MQKGSRCPWFACILVVLFAAGCGRRPQAPEVPSETAASVPSHALPDSAFAVRWGKVDLPSSLSAGKVVPVSVSFTNQGETAWPDADTVDPSGAYAVRLSYRWLGAEGPPVADYEDRIDLSQPLSPGETATLVVEVEVPAKSGSYRLQLDLVQELVAWFEAKGAPTLIIPVKVE